MTISARHLNAWQRQPGESAEAYLAFSMYRDLGPCRSARRAYRKWRAQRPAGAPARPALSGAWKRWHGKWRWQERAFACDREIDRQLAARKAEGAQLARAAELRQERAREERRLELLLRANSLIDWLLEQPISSVFAAYSSISRDKRQTVRSGKVFLKLARFARLYENRHFRGFTAFSAVPTGGQEKPRRRGRPCTAAGLARITALVGEASRVYRNVLVAQWEPPTAAQLRFAAELRRLQRDLHIVELEPAASATLARRASAAEARSAAGRAAGQTGHATSSAAETASPHRPLEAAPAAARSGSEPAARAARAHRNGYKRRRRARLRISIRPRSGFLGTDKGFVRGRDSPRELQSWI